jgi:serine/threonine protein kinase
MLYCINSDCSQRQNTDGMEKCRTCNSLLLLKERYQLIHPLHELGGGQTVEVFEVRDVCEDELKVLKILKVNQGKLLQLFRREAQVLQSLNHPGIPKVQSDGYFPLPSAEKPQFHCLIMERIEGQNLEQWLQKHQLTCEETALDWLKQLINILEHVHQNHFFHRDIKPSNIILQPTGKLALVDFGAARKNTDSILIGKDLTAILTLGYAPPEQLYRRAIPQSDFYALGRTFAHLLTKKHPIDFSEDKQGYLIWRNHLPPKISPLFADFMDELMASSIYYRPNDIDLIRKRIEQMSDFPRDSILSSIQRQILVLSRFKFWQNPALSTLIITVLVGIVCWWSFKPNPNVFIPGNIANPLQKKMEVAGIISEPRPQEGQKNRASGNFSLDSIPAGTLFKVEVTNLDGRKNPNIQFKIQYDISLAKDPTLAWDVQHGSVYKKPDGPARSLYIAVPKRASNQFRVRIYSF